MDVSNTLESQINRSDYKILIVDDVVSNVLLLKILLSNEKFQVCTANCGNMCIEQAKAEKPDLILLDVMMPDISGFDTAVILKKDPELKDIPIIFLTALNSPADLVKGFQVGASDFLSKPFNKEELVARVMHQIALSGANVRICQRLMHLERFGFNPLTILVVESFLCYLANVNLWVEVCGESFMMITGIAVHDVEMSDFVEVMLCCVGCIDARHSWVEAASEDCRESSLFESVFVGPLP